jgi:hypothetical protein
MLRSSRRQIADDLFFGRDHVRTILGKLSAESRAEVARSPGASRKVVSIYPSRVY